MCNACDNGKDHDFSSIPDGLADDELALAIAESGKRKALADIPAAPLHIEVCKSCRGSGAFYSYSGRYVGPCFKCKGKGKNTYKTSAATRANARAKSAERAVMAKQEIADNAAAFRAANPDIAAWMETSQFPFAIAMRDALAKYGDLTPKQLESTKRCVAQAIQWQKEKEAKAFARASNANANAPKVDVSKLVAAFDNAALTLKNPRLHLSGFKITRGKEYSKNPGALYFKSGETYLGKVANGAFYAARDCTSEQESAIVATCNDPKAAAIAYGLKYGVCSCCGRELTDPVSVANGIGPICAEKFGW